MAGAYATYDDYATATGDASSDEARVASMLETQSAKLRAALGIGESTALSGDALILARELVIDACRKALVPPQLDGLGTVQGATQASFSANGFSGSYTVSNPSGSAYFDRSTLAVLKRLLGRGQRIGTVPVGIGGAHAR